MLQPRPVERIRRAVRRSSRGDSSGSDEIGLGLVVLLAVGSQVLAIRLRIPAIIVLLRLPVGFVAGATTTIVHPDELLGAAFQLLVSRAVAVILYDAGLSLDIPAVRRASAPRRPPAEHPRRPDHLARRGGRGEAPPSICPGAQR